MADPTLVSGKLVNAGIADFSGMRVEARYLLVADDVETATSQSAQAGVDGKFALSLPPQGEWKGPLALRVTGGSGLVLGMRGGVAADDPNLAALDVEVIEDLAPAEVTDSEDPALGALARFTGRVIDRNGNAQRAGLTIVLWGVAPGEAEPYPVALARTSTGGYFAGAWPSDVLESAFARILGGDPIAIPLDGDRLPRRIILVADNLPEGEVPAVTDPPRAPTAEELAGQSEAFADDAGCCATFTTPNRTVEEVMFQAVVRTTQPEIKGSRARPVRPIPGKLVDKIVALTRMRPLVLDALAEPAAPEVRDAPVTVAGIAAARESDALGDAVRRGASIMQPASEAHLAAAMRVERAGGLSALNERAESVLEARSTVAEPVRLEASVVAELAREPGEITAARLLTAERASMVRDFRNKLDILAPQPVGRVELDPVHQANWDAPPIPYQATTIAHGHLLTMKQVWRADGYSLGDLLYSLPLAPGQQKLISILDWERRDEVRRAEHRVTTEDLSASLSHDRDISDIIRTALHERMDASSRANSSAVDGALGGFVGPVVFGAAGGVSKASSSASQASSRDIAASALNQARDRTLQSASAVRGQRATVVQTARQGEAVRAQTEAIANNNHCHAMTIEYFEVLRHFQVSQEMAHVQECLFIPFSISAFNDQKALRWRHVLQDLTIYHGGSLERLRPMFDALERVSTNWAQVDYPAGRYADGALRELNGELWITLSIPRPPDNEDHSYKEAEWLPYQTLLNAADPAALKDIWTRYMGVALAGQRQAIWDTRLAPAIARRLIDSIRVELIQGSATVANFMMDATLVSRFGQDRSLLVSFRPIGAVPAVTRAQVNRIRLSFAGLAVPAAVRAIVQSGSFRYRTDHMSHALFENYRIDNDLGASDPVEVATPLDKSEKRNPRLTDTKSARLLIDILNERLEYFHRLIWLSMDPNRRYMFLDGILAPDAGGRSVASVVENRVIGIVGNSLVMPVVPGLKLDPTYEFAAETQEDLRHHYASDPPPPMRISVPTRGVFAEAVMGKCNSCEKIDDTLFWRWEDAPIPDSPTAIQPLSTASRRMAPPSVTPGDFPTPLVRLQETPAAPDPTGLTAALSLIGAKGLFRDLTGLALNQENAAAALKSVMSTAQSFASHGAALAQQRFLSGQVDRNLDLIKKARDSKQITDKQAQTMTEGLFKGAIGARKPETPPLTEDPGVKKVMEKAAAGNGEVRVTRPGGTVEVKTGTKAQTPVDIKVDPPVGFIAQPSPLVCWAATGTMMKNWKGSASATIQATLDALGGPWRGKFDANETLTGEQMKAFADALGLKEEGPMSYSVTGLANLLKGGPLWIIGDNDYASDKVVHARILTAMKGDGSPDGTKLTFLDPASATPVEETFTKFAARLEAAEPVKVGRGIFHW